MTINTINDFNRDIEMLTDKMRQITMSAGIHTGDGYRFKYDAATGWDGVSSPPVEIADLANYMNSTPLQAKEYILLSYEAYRVKFRDSDVLKYNAKKEGAQSDQSPATLVTIYNKHLAIFEVAMYANV